MFQVDLTDTLKQARRDFSQLHHRNDTLLELLFDDITGSVLQAADAAWLPSFKGTHTRSKRQVAAALMFVGGYAAHSILSSISAQLFGSDDDVKQYVAKVNLVPFYFVFSY